MHARPSHLGLAAAPALLIALTGAPAALGGPLPPPAFPAVFELSSLDGTDGFVINGENAGDRCGHSVSSAGDINGDGFADIFVGAPRADPNGQSEAGRSYIVFGGSGVGITGTIDLGSLDGNNGFAINGENAGDRAGHSVSSAGDINGDGIDDVVIGAPYAAGVRDESGKTFVVFGSPTVGAAGAIDLTLLDGTDGFVINGFDWSDQSGFSVSAAGDINDDGFGDVLIGARYANPDGKRHAGMSFVVFGGPAVGASGALNLFDGFGAPNCLAFSGIDWDDWSGSSVAAAGDINGDGIDDILISAKYADDDKNSAGETYIVFGAQGFGVPGVFELSSLNGTNGFAINGIEDSDASGWSVSCAGDVNGDGFDDVIIGATKAGHPIGFNDQGETYIVFGGPGVGAGGSLSLSALNGTNGVVLQGITNNDRSGNSVSGAGDLNGDGYADVIIGASEADGGNRGGQSYVFFGGPAVGGAGVISLASLDGVNGFTINGSVRFDRSGWSVSGLGDVNGDSIDDIVIGAAFASPNGQASAGRSSVIFGRRSRPQNLCPADVDGDAYANTNDFVIMASNFGATVPPNTAGDLNGDGLVNAADFVILAADFGCGP